MTYIGGSGASESASKRYGRSVLRWARYMYYMYYMSYLPYSTLSANSVK